MYMWTLESFFACHLMWQTSFDQQSSLGSNAPQALNKPSMQVFKVHFKPFLPDCVLYSVSKSILPFSLQKSLSHYGFQTFVSSPSSFWMGLQAPAGKDFRVNRGLMTQGECTTSLTIITHLILHNGSEFAQRLAEILRMKLDETRKQRRRGKKEAQLVLTCSINCPSMS